MACNSCGSENQQQFPSEMAIHLPGLKNVNKPPVLAFPNVRICMDCGFTEIAILGSVLYQLGKALPRLACKHPQPNRRALSRGNSSLNRRSVLAESKRAGQEAPGDVGARAT
jgi:hypothetical protein